MNGLLTRPQRGIAVKDLFGGRFLEPEAVRHSMRALEARLDARFQERRRRHAEFAERAKATNRPILDLITKGEKMAESVEAVRRLHAEAQRRPIRYPRKDIVRERVFAGSIGATVAPSYDYEWTWSATAGSPAQNTESAERSQGTMAVDVWTDFGDNSSSVSGRAAVGTYFYPPAANGTLQVWSSPGFSDSWGDWCTFDSASADGWIGLYVESYDLSGVATGAIVDQQISLWSDSSWWNGVGSQEGSNSGYGLYAPPIQVDQDHQYIIWVWCGADASASGWGTFSGSGAGDSLRVTVPSITWELG
jgi:hypothetical protein